MADTALMQKALAEIRDLRTRLAASERARNEPIAIIGIGCRFPGGVDSPDTFWDLLKQGRDAIGPIPPGRWDVDAYYDPNPETPGKMYLKEGGFLPEVDAFDPQFFGVTPREAAWMDPQQRLLLEVSWEALEHAGCAPGALDAASTGVFAGLSSFNYASLILNSHQPAEVEPFFGTGNALSVAAGRLSYTLGWNGPALVIDTACSSSLAAVHLACASLRRGECSTALAGGAGLILTPDTTVNFCKAGMLARDGRCKSFDAAADGYVRSEGAGIVVLERLSDAISARRNIVAVIRGTACNHDGRSTGLTVPNGPAQQAVIRAALANAGIKPEEVGYLETHGTGTSLGDPLELGALNAVFRGSKQLLIGSVKTNLGHLEAAAGIAGVIKAALALQHGHIPAHLHFQRPTPHFAWNDSPLRLTAQAVCWPEAQPYAGVSSFGFSGTNAHAVLERAPAVRREPAAPGRPLHIYTLSAKSEKALDVLKSRHMAALDRPAAFADRCYTANTGRAQFAHRLAIVAGSEEELRQTHALGGQSETAPRIAFLFTGQGSQYAGMGRELYKDHPELRRTLDECDSLLRSEFDVPLLEALYGGAAAQLDETAVTQPALFALEFALASLWRQWGITPDIVMGHSLGEYVAACVAGVFSWQDGLRLAARRGRLMGSLPRDGAMSAVLASCEDVEPFVCPYLASVSLASVNGARHVVISGGREAIHEIAARLEAAGFTTRPLQVSHAFHSPLMDPIIDLFQAVVQEVASAPPAITLISNVTGKPFGPGEVPPASYWSRHLREPVQFAEGLRTLDAERPDIVIEIGPGATLLGMARSALAPDCTLLPSLRCGQPEWRTLLTSLATVYTRGGPVDWHGFDRPYRRRVVNLPTYPFERQRCWVGPGSHQRRSSSFVHEIHWQPVVPSASVSGAPVDVFVAGGDATAQQYCAALLERVQELIASASARRLWVVTHGALACRKQSVLRGIARVFARESPDRFGGMLDLDPAESLESQRGAFAEIIAKGGHGEHDLIRRNGQWYTARLRLADATRSAAVPVRPDATYLVTGGRGALGSQFVRKLLELGARRVVTVARSGNAASGPYIRAEQANAADRSAMRAILRRIADSGLPLRGIVHAAGVLEDATLLNASARQFARVLAPKAEGAWILHELTASLPLDFFVLCSSAVSVLGAPGQAAYAAANASLDALAHHRRALGLPAVSLNWGPWAGDSGMSAGRREIAGVRPLAPSTAADLFAHHLNPTEGQLLIIDADSAVLEQSRGATVTRSLSTELAGLAAGQRCDHLLSCVQQMAAGVMGLAPGQLPEPRRGFFDMGMDSLLAVELRNRLQACLPEVALPATLTFEHPSAAAVAKYLDSILPQSQPSQQAAAETTWDDDVAAELELLENMLRRNG